MAKEAQRISARNSVVLLPGASVCIAGSRGLNTFYATS